MEESFTSFLYAFAASVVSRGRGRGGSDRGSWSTMPQMSRASMPARRRCRDPRETRGNGIDRRVDALHRSSSDRLEQPEKYWGEEDGRTLDGGAMSAATQRPMNPPNRRSSDAAASSPEGPRKPPRRGSNHLPAAVVLPPRRGARRTPAARQCITAASAISGAGCAPPRPACSRARRAPAPSGRGRRPRRRTAPRPPCRGRRKTMR